MENVSAPPDYVLQRLDRLDTRLKQLEEKQKVREVPDTYFARDLLHHEATNLSQHCRPLSSALQEVHSKGTLMDRLHLLEARILQISYDLDKSNAGSSSINRESDDQIGLLQNAHDRKRHLFSSCGFNRRPDNLSHEKFHRSFNPNLKIKELKESSSVERRQGKCWNEKRIHNNQACRRWFAIGC